jgi:hypothetical protein
MESCKKYFNSEKEKEQIDLLLDKNISSILKMVFAGNISELSAKYMLNRYLNYI